MKALHASLIAALLAGAPPIHSQAQKVGWSLGYYCGWDQGGFAPASINWKAFTHIAHFAIVPNDDGSINVNANGLSEANCKAAVAEAHRQGKKIVICVGGAGVAGKFTNACSPANIHKFVSNIVQFMKKYGYDGIDTDWEESFNDAEMLAWHKELRDSIDKITPRPSLTIAGGGYFASHCAFVHPYIDQMNTMSYDVSLNGMAGEMKAFTDRGVPKAKLGVGIGIGNGGLMVDRDTNAAKAKALFAIANGFGGMMQWAVKGAALNTSVFKTLEQYVPASPVVIFDGGRLINEREAALSIRGNGITGVPEIRYTVAKSPGVSGAPIDLGLYDMRGTRLRSLVRGYSPAGTYTLSLGADAGRPLQAGRYLVRLTTAAGVESASASVLR